MATTIPRAPEVPTMTEEAEYRSDESGESDGRRNRTVDHGDAVEDRIRMFLSGEHRRVVATVSLWSGSADDAIDAVTDAVGRAWERLNRGETIDNLAAWVTTSAMNRVRSLHRRRATADRKRHLVAVTDSTDDTAAAAASVDLRRALARLTERQRAVVALHHGLDRSIDEIATDLGIAPGTVKSTLHQTRARLTELLDRPDTGGTR